jgi:hypothetical protein
MNRIYNKKFIKTHIQCHVEHKQHQEMNGIYNKGSNNTNANIQVPQIGTPSCTTLFLMVPSLPKQYSASHWTISTVDQCNKTWQKGPSSINGSKS